MGRGRREIGGQRRLLVQAGNAFASRRFAKSSEKVWQPLKGVGGWGWRAYTVAHTKRGIAE